MWKQCVLVLWAPKPSDHVAQRENGAENQFGVIFSTQSLGLRLGFRNTIGLDSFGGGVGSWGPSFFVNALRCNLYQSRFAVDSRIHTMAVKHIERVNNHVVDNSLPIEAVSQGRRCFSGDWNLMHRRSAALTQLTHQPWQRF